MLFHFFFGILPYPVFKKKKNCCNRRRKKEMYICICRALCAPRGLPHKGSLTPPLALRAVPGMTQVLRGEGCMGSVSLAHCDELSSPPHSAWYKHGLPEGRALFLCVYQTGSSLCFLSFPCPVSFQTHPNECHAVTPVLQKRDLRPYLPPRKCCCIPNSGCRHNSPWMLITGPPGATLHMRLPLWGRGGCPIIC